jgi:signal transduction histidine kinase
MNLAMLVCRRAPVFVHSVERLVLTLTAFFGLATVVRVRGEERRRFALEAANGRLQDALVARVDAFDRERAARAAAERASELQDRFLATVSHELRTPLNAIIGWTHVLRAGSLSEAQSSRAIDGIERNARAQSKLISDLLDISQLIRGRLPVRLVATDLRQPVGHAVENARPAAANKGLQLAYVPAAAEVSIVGDAERIEQIVFHLLSNALKFTPRGGHIGVKVVPDDEWVAVQVSDSGEGIAATEFQHLFEPFFQAETKVMRAGLGVGLAIVKELVTLHGGTVAVSSEGRGSGSTFAVTFPLARRTNQGATWPASTRRPQVPESNGSPRDSGPSGLAWSGAGGTS